MMRCPSCLTPATESLPECPQCRLSLAKLDRKFGTIPKHPRYLTDLGSLFELKEAAQLEKKIQAFERKFTGCYFSVVTTRLQPRMNPREYVFWLFNRCRFSPLEARLERNFSVVLFIDMNTGTAILTTGFGLEEHFPETELQEMVDKALPHFGRRDFLGGSLMILKDLGSRLKGKCRRSSTKRQPQRATPEGLPPEQVNTAV